MKHTLPLYLVCLSLAATAQKKNTGADPFAGLDTAFQRVLKDRKAAGFAVAVVSKDTILYAKGFGYRDYEKKIPVTPNTVFAIGSCTKAFTSSLMGLLNKDGKLEYDKPVRNYLPDLHFFNNEMNNLVTVRDLMCHRTGLPRHDYSWYLFNTPSHDSLVKRIEFMEPTASVRQIWQYNNFMFLLQGVIAEKLTGQSWESNVKEKIFTPLGMKSSSLTITELKKNPEAAIGYTVFKDSVIKKTDYYDISGMGPAGSINSSVNEMANWVMMWLNNGKFKGKEILPPGYVKEAMSSQMVASPSFPDAEVPDAFMTNYGFGWSIFSYRGHYRVEHGGNIDGFSASTCFFPSDSIGIIVLTNQSGSALNSIVRNMIADRLLKLKPVDWNGRANNNQKKAKEAEKEAAKTNTSNRKPGTKPSHSLNDYTGLFSNPGYGTFEIMNRNDSLILFTPTMNVWLRHFHYDIFEVLVIDKTDGIDTTDTDNLKAQFIMNSAGDITSVSMPFQPGLKDIEFSKKPKPKEVTKEELARYIGEYEFAPGTTVRFYIKGEKTLYGFIEGQPEYELVPTGKNKFVLKILDGYSVQFEENEKAEVIAATFYQPNGTFKAKRIK